MFLFLTALFAALAGIAGSLELMWGRFAAGGALVLGSVLALRWPRSIWRDEPEPELSPRVRRLALLGVCALGVFFRAYRFNQPGLWGDDALNGLLAFDILDGLVRSPFDIVPHSHSRFHALSNYLTAGAFALFGPDLTTLRLPGAMLNALCVPLLYGIVAPLFGSRVALLAALFFASAPPQLAHAKQLIQIVLGEFFQLAGLCLLVQGLAGARRRLIAAASVPLALCAYTYHSAKLAPLVAVPYLLAALRDPATRRSGVLPWVGAGTALFLLGLIPAVVTYAATPDALVSRVGETSLWPAIRASGSLWPLWDSVWRTLLMFHYEQGPEYHWFGLGFDPACNAVIGFLLVHGLVASLAAWREPRHVLLLAWVAVGLVPGFLSIEAPRLYRAFLATPPLYVWAALPLAHLLAVSPSPRTRGERAGVRGPLVQASQRLALRPVRVLAILLAASVPLVDFNYYFFRVYTHPTFRWFQGERLVDMARTLRSYGPGWTGYLLSDNFDAGHETFRFLSRCWGLTIRDVASLADVLPVREPGDGGALFMLSEGTFGAAAAMRDLYPSSTFITPEEPAPRSWWLDSWWPLTTDSEAQTTIVGYVPVARRDAERSPPPPQHGLLAEYEIHGERLPRHEPYPFYFFFPPTFPRRFDVRWRGRLTVPDPGGYRLAVEHNGLSADTWLDGRRLDANDPLPAGTHEFRLEIDDVPGTARLQIFWGRPGEASVLVPPGAWTPPE